MTSCYLFTQCFPPSSTGRDVLSPAWQRQKSSFLPEKKCHPALNITQNSLQFSFKYETMRAFRACGEIAALVTFLRRMFFSVYFIASKVFMIVIPAVNIHKTKQKEAPQFLYGTRTKHHHRFINYQIFLHTFKLIVQTGWIQTLIQHQNRDHLPLLSLQEEVGNLLSLFTTVHGSKGLTSCGFSELVAL